VYTDKAGMFQPTGTHLDAALCEQRGSGSESLHRPETCLSIEQSVS
jgi:hypothetical protein